MTTITFQDQLPIPEADAESRRMFVARLENMAQNGDRWLTVEAVLALLNDCDMLASNQFRATLATQPERKPMDRDSVIDLVKECGLDWHKGFMPLFDDDPTNRFAVLVEAVERHHGITEKP
jgi:hypothetical protein